MQKAINIDNSGATIVRILSITDISAVENSPNGLDYISVEYVEQPKVSDEMSINYPMYNKETGVMFWQTVDYQNTASAELLEINNLHNEIENLKAEKESLQEVVDTLLLESLMNTEGGADINV